MIALCCPRILHNIAAVPRHPLPTLPARNRPKLRLARWAASVGMILAALIGTRATMTAAAPPMTELVQAEFLAGVRAAFARKNVAYLKGDWTNRDPEISRVLERHGRSGVPLYLLYARGSEPVILPQILTPATVLEQIDRIGDQPQRKASLQEPSKE